MIEEEADAEEEDTEKKQIKMKEVAEEGGEQE